MSLLINRSKEWGFIHIPKTGGTSLREVLLKSDGTEYVSKSHNHIGKFENIKDYFIFCMVRNPFTRLASAYYHDVRNNGFKTFEKFINSIYKNDYLYFPQSYFIQNGSTEDKKISFIGRYENFINDVNFLKNNKDVFISMEIINYNGDEIYIDLKTNIDGFLTFVDNWSPGWKLYVNNKEKSIVKVLKAYKSAKINAGYNKIKFKYEPW